MEKITTLESKDAFLSRLISKFEQMSEHPLSANLPENEYSLVLKQDNSQGKAIEVTNLYHSCLGEYAQKGPNAKLGSSNSYNDGWKLHLSVLPENAHSVSEYLKTQGYPHKFLSGGDIDDGKIFTIYLGDYTFTKTEAEKIAIGLQGKLCKPVDHKEVEFGPGVVGRFRAEDPDFDSYGGAGVSYINTKKVPVGGRPCGYQHNIEASLNEEDLQKFRDELQKKSFELLFKKYGDYFYKE